MRRAILARRSSQESAPWQGGRRRPPRSRFTASGTARRNASFQRNRRLPASHALPAIAPVPKPECCADPVDQLAATDPVPCQPLQPVKIASKTDLILDLHVPRGTEAASPAALRANAYHVISSLEPGLVVSDGFFQIRAAKVASQPAKVPCHGL